MCVRLLTHLFSEDEGKTENKWGTGEKKRDKRGNKREPPLTFVIPRTQTNQSPEKKAFPSHFPA